MPTAVQLTSWRAKIQAQALLKSKLLDAFFSLWKWWEDIHRFAEWNCTSTQRTLPGRLPFYLPVLGPRRLERQTRWGEASWLGSSVEEAGGRVGHWLSESRKGRLGTHPCTKLSCLGYALLQVDMLHWSLLRQLS